VDFHDNPDIVPWLTSEQKIENAIGQVIAQVFNLKK